MTDDQPFNPLDKKNLGIAIAEELSNQAAVRLDQLDSFKGSGIYALYYTGPFQAYKVISQINAGIDVVQPIYVGKSGAPGSRKGQDGSKNERLLSTMIRTHRRNIEEVENLEVSDFYVKRLIVDDIFIPLGESLMIASYTPLWNVYVDGFGNNAPGGNRPQVRSIWDTLHPGRAAAAKLKDREETRAQLEADIKKFLEDLPLLTSGHAVQRDILKRGARDLPGSDGS
jgi:hypothetical protein